MINTVPFSKKLKNYFSNLTNKVYNEAELSIIILDFARAIRMPLDAETSDYILWLTQTSVLRQIEFTDKEGKRIRRFAPIKFKPSDYEIALTLKRESYISHQSAAFLHGLVKDIPPFIYITLEGAARPAGEIVPDQEAIDNAFSKSQRKSKLEYISGETKVLLHTGKFAGRMGVIEMETLPISNIERTLLDMTVRPLYSGGPKSILEAYTTGIKNLNVETLVRYLDEIGFTYPYHQSIGFYLETAGYQGKILKTLSKRRRVKFYLDYAISNPDFNEKWQVYYPQEMLPGASNKLRVNFF